VTPARILVVDDEPGMLRAIDRSLGTLHQVSTSASSSRALELAAELNPDLAILDIRMPELDGFTLMHALKTQHPDLDVVLMTGSVDDRDEKLVRALRGDAFYFIQKPFDRDVLRALVDRCVELRRQRQANRRHLSRLEGELAAARAFQESLLPAAEASYGGLRIVCHQTSWSELGGDLYDHAVVGAPATCALLIADVAGHGAIAAMLTGVVKSAFRAAERDRYAPVAVAERLLLALAPFGFERFVTLIAATIAAGEDCIRYVNAGHPAGCLWNSSGRLDRLHSTGPFVSPAFPDSRWAEASLPLRAGDRLLLYTDGVLDGLSHDDDQDSRLLAAIERCPEGGRALLEAVNAEIRQRAGEHGPDDDVTLLSVAVDQTPLS
jgi:serine phosphatase RsbU (regulator of sigma subunit)